MIRSTIPWLAVLLALIPMSVTLAGEVSATSSPVPITATSPIPASHQAVSVASSTSADKNAPVQPSTTATVTPTASTAPTATTEGLTNSSTAPPTSTLPRIAHPSQAVTHAMRTYPFSNGDTVSVPLSNTDINRLMVKGDQITGIICPAMAAHPNMQLCKGSTPTNAQGQSLDPSHSGYLTINPQAKKAFSVQLTTLSHRYLTLLVIPQQIPGVTVRLKPMDAGIGNKPSLPQGTSYTEGVAMIMKKMMTHHIPEGYGYQQIHDAMPLQVNKQLAMVPLAIWRGRIYTGTAYQLINPSKRAIQFDERLFYHQGVAAIALTKDYLGPKQTGVVYILSHRGER